MSEGQEEGSRVGHERILLVEDDDLVRGSVERHLVSLGYLVASVSNGSAALEALRAGPGEFDLLFTDIMMPGGMSGAQLAEEVGRLSPRLPVLFTSGSTESVVRAGHGEAEVPLLQKPYRRNELAEKVRNAIDRVTS